MFKQIYIKSLYFLRNYFRKIIKFKFTKNLNLAKLYFSDLKHKIFKIKSLSQAGQDKFVLSMLNNKKNGTYIEIGAYEPIEINNTYILEKKYNWTGFSIEIEKSQQMRFNKIRKNKCILADGTKFNYENEIKRLWGNIKRIDYLQLDVDPAETTYECLCALPLDKIRFSVITFETDYYRYGEKIRKLSREKLKHYGYKLIAADVTNESVPFEDWYVDPDYVDISIYKKYICKFKEGKFIC